MQGWYRRPMRKAIEEQHRREAVDKLFQERPDIIGSQAVNRLGKRVVVEEYSPETAMVLVRRVSGDGPSYWVSPDKLIWR